MEGCDDIRETAIAPLPLANHGLDATPPCQTQTVHAGTHDPGYFRAHSGAVAFQTAHS